MTGDIGLSDEAEIWHRIPSYDIKTEHYHTTRFASLYIQEIEKQYASWGGTQFLGRDPAYHMM